MKPYVEGFDSNEDIISNYGATSDALDGTTIFLAWYGYGSYDGQSLVIFEKDGQLYEVNGSHCSCHGLEGQWKPEETSWKALAMRDLDDRYTSGAAQADQLLKALVKEHLKVEPNETDVSSTV
jgi:hypothetical protein